MTRTAILKRIRSARAQTSFYPQTNATLYPARWDGHTGVSPDCTTSAYYDQRTAIAAEHVADALGLDGPDGIDRMDFEGLTVEQCADRIMGRLDD